MYSNKIQSISKKHGRSEHWTSHQLFISDIMCTHHRPTAWNSFICEHLNDINETHHTQESVQKQAVIHDQPKAVQCKMSTAFKTMHKEWSSLCSSLGMEGFYVVVHRGVEDLSTPKVFFSLKGDKFVCLVLDLEPRCLALKLESFVVSGLADKFVSIPQSESHPLNKLVGECHSAIQKGLGDILHDNGATRSVCMNYDNYECKIVEHFGMELIGWPNDLLPICNPGQLGGCGRVQKLLVALTTKIYKPCKKHTSLGTKKSAAIIASDANDNGISDGSDCDEGSSAA
ncbi:hypothetical protein EDC04DRAFT_2603024 [Pisolithus marmoratus]|nr:hypothetical protein EDC04DRAFT_2603024 [Pisolithus marmoratus]